MAAQGNQPVSAANLAAALGISAAGSIGSQPICVDNLAAVLASGVLVGEVLAEGPGIPDLVSVHVPIETYVMIELRAKSGVVFQENSNFFNPSSFTDGTSHFVKSNQGDGYATCIKLAGGYEFQIEFASSDEFASSARLCQSIIGYRNPPGGGQLLADALSRLLREVG